MSNIPGEYYFDKDNKIKMHRLNRQLEAKLANEYICNRDITLVFHELYCLQNELKELAEKNQKLKNEIEGQEMRIKIYIQSDIQAWEQVNKLRKLLGEKK